MLLLCAILALTCSLLPQVACAWYFLAFTLIFVLFNEPSYTGPSAVETLTGDTFVEKCASKEQGGGGANGGATYVVFCGTQWSAR